MHEDWVIPRPQDYVKTEDLPDAFTWADKDGESLVTKSLNQHIPQVNLTAAQTSTGSLF